MIKHHRLLAALVAVALLPASLLGQEPARVSGRVTNAAGAPEAAVTVRIDALGASSTTGADGGYSVVLPASRLRGEQRVTIVASRVGLKSASRSVVVRPGVTLTENFELRTDVLSLEGIVATGQGINQERRQVGSVVSSVPGELIRRSNESSVVAALAGKAPNVWVTKSSGDPGAGAYIVIRGAKTVAGSAQPLFVVDGMPIDNSSVSIEDHEQGTAIMNRAGDVNPNDIQSVEILKGAAASAIYGSRAAHGAVLITTKSGRRNSSRASFRTTYSADEVNTDLPLQNTYGRGIVDLVATTQNLDPANIRSWGPQLATGTRTYDHWDELFRTGHTVDSNLEVSGGGDRSTYFLSLGMNSQDGVLRGNSEYDRVSVRLKGDHWMTENLRVAGNFNYVRSSGDLLQQGNTTSGVILSATRQPAEFNACRTPAEGSVPGRCWLNEAGLHFSYRNPNPAGVADFRGFDNPFWSLNEVTSTSDVGRFIGNVQVDYQALPWLSVQYMLGADYANDSRRSVFPKGSSDYPDGRLVRADILNEQYDHSLLATARYRLSERVTGTVTAGQNLNQRELRSNQTNGQNLLFGADALNYTVLKIPAEYRSRIRTDGYFVQGTADVSDRLFLTGALRLDGSSTFGGTDRALYPKLSAAYDFTRLGGLPRWLDLGKLRAAYGEAGTQPPAYAAATAYGVDFFYDPWLSPNGLYTVYHGSQGVRAEDFLGNADIRPERTRELEAGIDLALLDSRVALGVTYYNARTTGGILAVPTAWSTGHTAQYDNVMDLENRGWEVTLDLNPVQRDNFSWTVGLQWAKNDGCVKNLATTATFIEIGGFPGSYSGVAAPERDADGNVTRCYDHGVLYGNDWIRFGRGRLVRGVNIDQAYPDAQAGDLYIDSNGFPVMETALRVIGDPNPDWTGSVRTALTLFNSLQISGLLDIKHGGQMWNGTRGALYSYGTHKDTEPWHGAGQAGLVFGSSHYGHERVAGPGAGQPVVLNWATWGFLGGGNTFFGPDQQFVEDAGFVKLRDVTLAYTLERPFLRRYGLSSLELALSGRNLKTWTRYTGLDPESNVSGQIAARGLDFFNNPQTRSYVLSVTLNR